MVRSRLLLGGLLAAAVAGVRGAAPPVNIVPGAYIVEYEDGADSGAFLESIAGQADTRMHLDYKLFKGVSIKFHNLSTADEQASSMQSMPPVKKVWPVRLYAVPEYTVHSVAGDNVDDEGAEAFKRQAASEPDTFSPHVMIQVNKLRDEGVVGDGIKMAVIDTGVS